MRKIGIILAISLLFISCGSSSVDVETSIESNVEIQSNNAGEGVDLDPEIQKIVKASLGGAILQEFTIADFVSDDYDMDIEVEEEGANVGFSGSVDEISEELPIDGGSIETEGTIETIISINALFPVFYLAPINMTTSLDEYEADDMVITGDIQTEFRGRLENLKLIGKGKTKTEGALTIIYNEEEYSVSYDVEFSIRANPFDITNYEINGDFSINGIQVDISKLF